MDINIDLHFDEPLTINTTDRAAIAKIYTALKQIYQQGTKMAGQLDALTAAVAENTAITNNIVTLISSSVSDTAALAALVSALQANTKKLTDIMATVAPQV